MRRRNSAVRRDLSHANCVRRISRRAVESKAARPDTSPATVTACATTSTSRTACASGRVEADCKTGAKSGRWVCCAWLSGWFPLRPPTPACRLIVNAYPLGIAVHPSATQPLRFGFPLCTFRETYELGPGAAMCRCPQSPCPSARQHGGIRCPRSTPSSRFAERDTAQPAPRGRPTFDVHPARQHERHGPRPTLVRNLP